MTEEIINDKEPMTELLYRKNKSELESEAEDSEYDSKEDEDSGKKIKKIPSETKSIKNKIPIKCISKIPPTKKILLTIQRTLVYTYSCGHTKRIKYALEKKCTTNKKIRIDAISKIKEYKETKFQCVRVKESRSDSNSKASQRKLNQEDIA